MSFMMVFQKPGNTACSRNCDVPTLAAATKLGQELAAESPAIFGEFLYARTCFKESIELKQLYQLKPTSGRMNYRREEQSLFGPFDYLTLTGGHNSHLGFPLTWKDPATSGRVTLTAWFESAAAGKFQDLCKRYLARFSIQNSKPVLEFICPNSLTAQVAIELSVRE